MKILEINKFNFAKGGADKHFLDIVKLWQKEGHEVAVFSMQHGKNKPSRWDKYFLSQVGYDENYSFGQKIRGVGRMFYSWEAKKKINQLLDDFQPEIVHIHNIYHQMSPLILFEIKKRKIPVIMTVHDYKIISPNYDLYLRGRLYDHCRGNRYYNCFRDKCVKNSYLKSLIATLESYWHGPLLKTYSKNVDVFVVPSFFVRDILVSHGLDESRIQVIPHFTFPPEDSFFLASSKKQNQDFYVGEKYALYFGRICREKGVDRLIEIFQKVEGLKLYLAGQLENGFILPENPKIKYLGFLEEKEITERLEKAACSVSASKLPETFGLSVLESISYGCPFIGFKTGAYPEIIKNFFNGYLAEDEKDLGNFLEKIASQKIDFERALIARQALEQFSPARFLEKFNQLVKNLTENKRS